MKRALCALVTTLLMLIVLQPLAQANPGRIHLDPEIMRPLDDQVRESAPSLADPALSLRITRQEIGVPAFTAETGSDGSGVLIAIIDTGVDPGHPALTSTPAGEAKIADWQDFSGEGDVALTERWTEPIPGITSQSGTYQVGYFEERQIPFGEMGADINRNGRTGDRFRLLATDAHVVGFYDTLYVDTDGDGSLADEEPLSAYYLAHRVGQFGKAGLPFVVTRLDPAGSWVNLGFDGGLHGTHVAAIAAGSGPITGVAPGAQILAVKVLGSDGSGSWAAIAQGIEYAAERGAQVINLSLGGLIPQNDGSDPLSRLIARLARERGILFTIAAGNAGPGVETVNLPGVSGGAICVGAYISPQTWWADYGLEVPAEGLWYFSSAGPRADGGLKPDLVAPGAATSAIGLWAGGYGLFQGTSMAAPQVAGATALLLSAAKAQGLPVVGAQVRSALEQSARRLPGYGWFEQGYGLVQVDRAWLYLRWIAGDPLPTPLLSLGKADRSPIPTGFFGRERVLQSGPLAWWVGNRSDERHRLDLTYRPGTGLTLAGPSREVLEPRAMQRLTLSASLPSAPGIYDLLVEGRLDGLPVPAVQLLATAIQPQPLPAVIRGSLAPARYARHFIRVEPGTAAITIQVNVPERRGRVRLMLYLPSGLPYGDPIPWVGAPQGPDQQRILILRPEPGLWELDVYASHGAMLWHLAENGYELRVTRGR